MSHLKFTFCVADGSGNDAYVPNGAKCEDGKMCLNARCVEVPKKPELCRFCGGQFQTCNQDGHCYCGPNDTENCFKGGF